MQNKSDAKQNPNAKQNSDVKKMIKEALILFIITLVAGVSLGFVYELTKEPIAKQQELKVQKACKEVFADADHFREEMLSAYLTEAEDIQMFADITASAKEKGVTIGDVFYIACDTNEEIKGYIFNVTSGEGYGGNITMLAGYKVDGSVSGISLLTIAETPGLGMQAEDVLLPQYVGQNVAEFSYTKIGKSAPGEVDAISGATITTEAVTNAVNTGLTLYQNLFAEGKGEQ